MFIFFTDESEEVTEGGEGDSEGHVSYVISADVHFTSSKMTRYIHLSSIFIEKF